MTPKRQTGEALISGTISAEDQRAELHRVERTDGIPLTPMQQRALAEDRYPGDDVAPGYSSGTVVVSDGRPRPRTNAAEPDAAWDRIDAAKAEPSQRAQTPNEAAELLRRDAQEHARRQIARTAWAKANGTPEQKRQAATEAAETAALLSSVRERLDGSK